MDTIGTIIEFLGTAVMIIGLFVASAGGIQYGHAQSQSDAQGKSTALALIGGGAVIAAVGIFAFPAIAEAVTSMSM